jgi:hypothetical protein
MNHKMKWSLDCCPSMAQGKPFLEGLLPKNGGDEQSSAYFSKKYNTFLKKYNTFLKRYNTFLKRYNTFLKRYNTFLKKYNTFLKRYNTFLKRYNTFLKKSYFHLIFQYSCKPLGRILPSI